MICILLVAGHGTVLETQIKVSSLEVVAERSGAGAGAGAGWGGAKSTVVVLSVRTSFTKLPLYH